MNLPRSVCSFEHLAEYSCKYTPGPTRILGVGDISDPRLNFKAFQHLSEKHTSNIFVWHGATRTKTWGNMHLYTSDASKLQLLSTCDYLIWCADDDPCPLTVFEALYLGVRVFLFEKSIAYNLSPLFSDIDGSQLLHISKGAAQHCPLHLVTKNSKAELDVMKSRAFAIRAVTTPCEELVQHIKRHIAAFSSLDDVHEA